MNCDRQPQKHSHGSKFRRVLLAGAVAAFLLPVCAFVFARPLLCIEQGPPRGEVIIVLGGESAWRASRALELFRENRAATFIVSGDGDGAVIREHLISGGVPPAAIEWENRSRSTKENAEFTAPLLRAKGIRHAVLITSWFHSRRALNCFNTFAPSVRFSSQPAPYPERLAAAATHILQEYVKTAWYSFHYHISPWPVRPAESS
jgi:uncharacterized SAM-binding protein YcdF (DUF218 family)